MATSLLLEGDDLEALLARARAEGGPHARIVRAEKLRHGGVLGFFAKERFEVALEIPDEFRPPAVQEEPMSEPAPAPIVLPPAGPGALERLTRRLTAAAEDPEVAAREGILGLAQRADAVELAAARPAQVTVPDALDLALRKLLDPEPAGAVATVTAPPATRTSPVRPSTSRPEFTALLDDLLVPTRTSEATVAGVPKGSAEPPSTPSPAPAHTPSLASPAPSPMSSPMSSSVPPAYREVSLPPSTPAPAYVPPAQPHSPAPTTRPREASPAPDRREDHQLAEDRDALRDLGVPASWTRQLRPGDRFTAVLRMLDRMPDVDIDPATRVVAVVGPASSVLVEAHRTALDLASEAAGVRTPRTVVHVPAAPGAERATALAEARLLGNVVVAVEAEPTDAARAVEALQIIGAGAVIAIVAADGGLEPAQAFLDALGQVDALAVDGAAASLRPAAILQLGLPVVRLDGIPVDRYTWTAVLCAQLAR